MFRLNSGTRKASATLVFAGRLSLLIGAISGNAAKKLSKAGRSAKAKKAATLAGARKPRRSWHPSPRSNRMVLRDSKGKRRKRAKEPTDAIEPAGAFGKQSKGEALLVSKLQKESLKVHGDSLDAPKKAPAKKKGK